MNAKVRKYIKGALEVRARVPTRMGNSDYLVPKGYVGYVKLGDHYEHLKGRWLVFWPDLPGTIPNTTIKFNDSFRQSSHLKDELELTGRRG